MVFNKARWKHFLVSNKKKIVLIACGTVLLAIVLLILVILLQPSRTVANFCRVAKEQKSILVGDVNYEKRVEAYKKLEAVSPDEIQPDIAAIRKGYETIVQNPSNALGVGFGIMGSESRRSTYIKTNCSDF